MIRTHISIRVGMFHFGFFFSFIEKCALAQRTRRELPKKKKTQDELEFHNPQPIQNQFKENVYLCRFAKQIVGWTRSNFCAHFLVTIRFWPISTQEFKLTTFNYCARKNGQKMSVSYSKISK